MVLKRVPSAADDVAQVPVLEALMAVRADDASSLT
jgi:hypothetical protein